MPHFEISNAYITLPVLVFVAVLLGLEGAYLLWKTYLGREAKKLSRRLDTLVGMADPHSARAVFKQKSVSAVPLMARLVSRLPAVHALEQTIYQAGLQWTPSALLLSSAVAGGAGYVAVTLIARQSAAWGFGAAGLLAALPLLFLYRKRTHRLRKFEEQLPEALDIMVRGLKSGHGLSSALQMLADEMAEPIAGEFRLTHEEINFGGSLQSALTNLAERVPITDLRYFVVSVLIQRDSGGNLSEVLANLRRLIRERLRLLAKVRVLSTEGRMSAWVLGIMPFALGGLMNFFNPEFMSLMWTDPMGIVMIKTLLTMMTVGVLVIVRIVRIRV